MEKWLVYVKSCLRREAAQLRAVPKMRKKLKPRLRRQLHYRSQPPWNRRTHTYIYIYIHIKINKYIYIYINIYNIYIYIYKHRVHWWKSPKMNLRGVKSSCEVAVDARVARGPQSCSETCCREETKTRTGLTWERSSNTVLMFILTLMMMMMMMMTLMKLVDSATKFRHGIDKFYQPNSGLRSSKTWDEAIYTMLYYAII